MFDSTQIAAEVEAIENRADVEIVVVVAPAASSYPKTVARFSALAAYALGVFLVLSPWEFDPIYSLVGLGVFYLVFSGLLSRRLALLARLAGPRFLKESKQRAAHEAFTAEGVHATRDRHGLLFLVFCAENELSLRGDLEILNRFGEGRLNILEEAFARDSRPLPERVPAFLEKLGDELAPVLPKKASETEGEGLPNAPRFRSFA